MTISSLLAYVALGTHSFLARHLAVVVRRQSTNQMPQVSDGNTTGACSSQDIGSQGSRPVDILIDMCASSRWQMDC